MRIIIKEIEKLVESFCKEYFENPTRYEKDLIKNAMLQASNKTMEIYLEKENIEDNLIILTK